MPDKNYSTYNNNAYGPTFGGGHDLYISNQANAYLRSYSSQFSYNFTGRSNIDFAGAYNFKVL
jgi:hypothetical protein